MKPIAIQVESLVVGPLMANCYLLYDQSTKQALLIDPGDDADSIIQRINELDLDVEMILATHAHFDHVGGVAPLLTAFNVPFLLHKEEVNDVAYAGASIFGSVSNDGTCK